MFDSCTWASRALQPTMSLNLAGDDEIISRNVSRAMHQSSGYSSPLAGRWMEHRCGMRLLVCAAGSVPDGTSACAICDPTSFPRSWIATSAGEVPSAHALVPSPLVVGDMALSGRGRQA
nr:hypothetical protein CFP56_12901 [Quercus suber]